MTHHIVYERLANDQITNIPNTYDEEIPIRCPECRIRANGLRNYNTSARHDKQPLLKFHNGAKTASIDFHCHAKPNKSNTLAIKQLTAATVLCFIFMIAELLGGIVSNSLALVTDALHLISDLVGFFVSIVAIHLAKKKPTSRYSFGLLRADVMGALLSIMIIWVLMAILCFLAVERIYNNNFHIEGNEMLFMATFGVVVNLIIGFVLHSEVCLKLDSRFSHGHSHGAPEPRRAAIENKSSAVRLKMEKNINVRAAFIHVIGDLLQSVGVFVSALIIRVQPEYRLADPICTLIFSVITIFTTSSIMIQILHVIMEAVPHEIDYVTLRNELCALDGVHHVHSLAIWSLTIDKIAVNVHLAISSKARYDDVLAAAHKLLRDDYEYHHICVQVEPYNKVLTKQCEQCSWPLT